METNNILENEQLINVDSKLLNNISIIDNEQGTNNVTSNIVTPTIDVPNDDNIKTGNTQTVNDTTQIINDNTQTVNDNIQTPNNLSIVKQPTKKTTLILSGGGIKGLALIGSFRALESLNVITDITTFAGSSVGALIMSLYVIGYNANELYKFIKFFNFDIIKNIKLLNIFSEFGVDNGQKVEHMLEKLIINKKLDKNITLSDIFNKTGKELIFTSVCLNTTQVSYISYKNYPELPLIQAIRMTISIPWFYSPVLHCSKLYVDGGCIDNYPIHLFKDNLDSVIGIYLLDSYGDIDDITNLETYSIQVVKCFMQGMSFNSTKGYEKNTIFINLKDINIIDYNLSIDKKKELCKIGFKTVMNSLLV